MTDVEFTFEWAPTLDLDQAFEAELAKRGVEPSTVNPRHLTFVDVQGKEFLLSDERFDETVKSEQSYPLKVKYDPQKSPPVAGLSALTSALREVLHTQAGSTPSQGSDASDEITQVAAEIVRFFAEVNSLGTGRVELSGSRAEGLSMGARSDYDFLLYLDGLKDRLRFAPDPAQPEFGWLEFHNSGEAALWTCALAQLPNSACAASDGGGHPWEPGSHEEPGDEVPGSHEDAFNSLAFSAFFLRQVNILGPSLALPHGWTYDKAQLNGPTVTVHLRRGSDAVEADLTLAVHFTGKPPCAAADTVTDFHVVPARISSKQLALWMVSPKRAEQALTRSLSQAQLDCLRMLKALAKSMDTYMWSSYAAKCVVVAEARQHPLTEDWAGDSRVGSRLLSMLHRLAEAAASGHLPSPLLPGLNAWKARLPKIDADSGSFIKMIVELAECLVWEADPAYTNPFKELAGE